MSNQRWYVDWSKPTDEAGQVSGRPRHHPRLFKRLTAFTSLQLEHLTTQDLLLRRCWKGDRYTSWTWNLPLSGAVGCHFGQAAFLFISQSGGNSYDSRQVWLKANEMGIPNDGDKRTRDQLFLVKLTILCCFMQVLWGNFVASTKAYTAQAQFLFLPGKSSLWSKWQQRKPLILVHELSIVAQSIESTLQKKNWLIARFMSFLKTTRNAFYIGRGQDYYVTRKPVSNSRISYIQCEGFCGRGTQTRTIALIEDGTVSASCQTQFLLTTLVGISKKLLASSAKISQSQKNMLPKVQMTSA